MFTIVRDVMEPAKIPFCWIRILCVNLSNPLDSDADSSCDDAIQLVCKSKHQIAIY